jgi:hypothetical protein
VSDSVDFASSNSTSPPPGWSGKRLAGVLGIGLVVVMIGLGNELWVYAKIEQTQEQTKAAWRTLASALGNRHSKLEPVIVQGVDRRLIPMELGEKFRLAIGDFTRSLETNSQLKVASDLEQVLAEIETTVHENEELDGRWKESSTVTDELRSAVDSYNQSVRQQKQIRTRLGGRILLAFIKLAEPVEFTAFVLE